jgi:CRP/FNR family transcriptional regulator, anaerobic regulatory protein
MESKTHPVECHNCRLATSCLAKGLDDNETKQLEAIVSHKRPLKLSEFLYRQDDQAHSFFIVKSGSFRSTVLDSEGIENTVDFHLPGELIGLEALQKGQFRGSVVALETASVCELPLAQLNPLCSKIPALQAQLLHIIGSQFVALQDRAALLGNHLASEKMTRFLLMLSHRYSNLGYSSTEFNLSMPRYDIASFLCLSLETVSRQLKHLKEKGLISVQKRGIHINSLESLKNSV